MHRGLERQHRHKQVPIRQRVRGDKQPINSFNIQLLLALRSMKLRCAQLERLVFLTIRAAEHDHLSPQLIRELDSQMPQPSHPNNTNAFGGFSAVGSESIEDGRAGALERGRELRGYGVRDLEDEGGAEDGVGG